MVFLTEYHNSTDFYCVINVIGIYIYRVCCVGLGAWLVVTSSVGGGGGSVCGGPRYIIYGIPWNGHLFWSTFVLGGGGNVTFPGIGFPANTFISNVSMYFWATKK